MITHLWSQFDESFVMARCFLVQLYTGLRGVGHDSYESICVKEVNAILSSTKQSKIVCYICWGDGISTKLASSPFWKLISWSMGDGVRFSNPCYSSAQLGVLFGRAWKIRRHSISVNVSSIKNQPFLGAVRFTVMLIEPIPEVDMLFRKDDCAEGINVSGGG